jgi:hypothetical protein
MPDLENLPSNLYLIHLAYDFMMDDDILWLVAQYCDFAYGQKSRMLTLSMWRILEAIYMLSTSMNKLNEKWMNKQINR